MFIACEILSKFHYISLVNEIEAKVYLMDSNDCIQNSNAFLLFKIASIILASTQSNIECPQISCSAQPFSLAEEPEFRQPCN